jgi:hypothetical protein
LRFLAVPVIFIFCKAFRPDTEHPQPLIQTAPAAIPLELRRPEVAFGNPLISRAEDKKE